MRDIIVNNLLLKRLGLLLVFSLCHFHAFTQLESSNLRSEYFSIHNGLNAAEVFSITETDDGYMWLATGDGLFRYDAHTFKQFSNVVGDSTSISDNYIGKMCRDKYNRIWMSAGKYLNLFDTKTFKAKKIYQGGFSNSFNATARDFYYQADKDIMWICGKHGLFYNEGKQINVKQKTFPDAVIKYTTDAKIMIDGHIMWIANTYGLCRYNSIDQSYKIYHHPNAQPGLENDDRFFCLYKDEKGIIWIGNWTKGMVRLDPVNDKMEVLHYQRKDLQNGEFKITNLPIKGMENLLIACTIHGLKFIDKDKRKYISDKIIEIENNNEFTFYNSYYSKKSGLWFGSAKGLYRIDVNARFLKSIDLGLQDRTRNLPMTDIHVQQSKDKRDSIVWMLGSYDKIYKYDLINKKEVAFPPKLQQYNQLKNVIYTMHFTKNNQLWFSSAKDFLIGYDVEKDIVIKPVLPKIDPKIGDIKSDGKGNLWCGTVNGLTKYNAVDNIFSSIDILNHDIEKNGFSLRVGEIEVDHNGNLWLVSGWSDKINGVIFFNPQTEKIKYYDLGLFPDLLSSSPIENILASKEYVMISGHNGLTQCSYNAEGIISMENISQKQHWKSKYLRNPILANNKNIWYATKFGLLSYNAVNRSTVDYNHINTNIGLGNYNLFYSNQSGLVYISNLNKLDYFDPKQVASSSLSIPRITEMSIANYHLDSLPKYGDGFILKSHQNSIQIAFSNFSYNNSIENAYFYKLNDEQEWKKMVGNKLSFDGLGKGQYTMKVISSNCYGTLNKTPYILHFKILPPFYQSWWFIALSLLSIAALLFYFYTAKINELQRLHTIRLNIARDLHDDMGSNLSHIKMLSEVEAMTNPDQPVFKTIVEKMNEVMGNMSEIIWNANPSHDKIEDVLYRIQEYAIQTLEPLGISVKIDFQDIKAVIKLDIIKKRNFYLIFKEAINNISKYAKSNKVTLSSSKENGHLIVVIKDNGIGFDPSLIKKGNGLVNMQDRAKLLGGELGIETSAEGTIVRLRIIQEKMK